MEVNIIELNKSYLYFSFNLNKQSQEGSFWNHFAVLHTVPTRGSDVYSCHQMSLGVAGSGFRWDWEMTSPKQDVYCIGLGLFHEDIPYKYHFYKQFSFECWVSNHHKICTFTDSTAVSECAKFYGDLTLVFKDNNECEFQRKNFSLCEMDLWFVSQISIKSPPTWKMGYITSPLNRLQNTYAPKPWHLLSFNETNKHDL